ncbi:Clp protease N-terminal domain-containing protein [Herbidospora yilanensis]|uniref:Clp protease N-terminal domain-containing protein n=1 Tax=Herbidospora yilanensis TaxID=354426 RepID=UPI0007805DB9|nr:Clp protease N-terminal domain-containing protein [Herbidospora yilanensis]
MFERFTDRARQVIMLASEEARDLGHRHLGTEHVMLGLIREGHGLAAQALAECQADVEPMRAVVARLVGEPRTPPAETANLPFTPRTKKILELALREAMRRNDRYVSTEHILLATLREGQGIAVHALAECGIPPEVVEDALERRMAAQGAKDRSVIDRLTDPGDHTIQATLRRYGEDRHTMRRVLESLESLHRRLDAMGAPPDPGK